MKESSLGINTLQISNLGLGCMGMSECYGKIDDLQSIKTIHRAFELGITHFDTADCYGLGHNERLVGKAVKGFRDKIVIASKCGMVRNPETGEFLAVNGSPEYIKKACVATLKRLEIDYLDLFYLHRVDPNTPIEESVMALSELVAEGKVLNIGLSEVSVKTIARAHQVHSLTAVQSEYSLWHRKPELEVIPLCQSLNIGFVAHGPLGKGFFTGMIETIDTLDQNDIRRILPRFQDENIKHNLQIIHVLKDIANNYNVTPGQIALAWALNQADNIVAIAGTRQIAHLEENRYAAELKLSAEELLQIEQHIPVNFPQGDLLPKSFAKFSEQ
jgi:aryl-alcohol dehydrogenase-like predicted oxidoreductase